MIQQFTAIEWSTEPQPFPQLIPVDRAGRARTRSGCRSSPACSWSAGWSSSTATPWSAAPSSPSPRITSPPARSACRNAACASRSYALAGAIGGLAGFAGGGMLLAFFANVSPLNFYGFIPVALGGIGNNRGAVVGRPRARPVPAGGELPGGRRVRLGRRVRRVHRGAVDGAAGPVRRTAGAAGVMAQRRGCRLAVAAGRGAAAASCAGGSRRSSCCSAWPALLPLTGNAYFGLIVGRAAVYWVLVSGLNLVVGFAGQLAIGWASRC